MKAIQEQSSYYDYQEIIDSFEYENLFQETDNDYQGDTRVLFRDGNRFGILNFGWGSCSGCDALQACDTIEEVTELQQELFNSIQWFDSAQECLNHFLLKDFSLEWNSENAIAFQKGAISALEKQIGK